VFIFKHQALLTLLFALPLSAQPARFLSLDDFVTDWRISKQFTIAVAEKMPAASYDFKATPEERSFDYVIQVLPKLTDEQRLNARFKVDFEGRPGPEINGRDMIMNIFVHVAHLRAQCEVYLRLKGIAPPEYTF
jgi:hypothetical protein